MVMRRGAATVHRMIIGIGLGVSMIGGPALAAAPHTPKPDPVKGRALAERACVACHVVSERAVSPVAADVPTFAAIANKPGQTMEAIDGRIVIPPSADARHRPVARGDRQRRGLHHDPPAG